MEWVIAALAVGCVFFAAQVVADYLKYKRVIAPRIQHLEAAGKDLRARIESSRAELDEKRTHLEPIKDEVERLEREYFELQQELEQERARVQDAGRQKEPL